MFCSSCGAKLVDGAKFCGQCGAKTAEISFPQTVEKVKPPVAEAPAAEIPQEPIAPPVTAAQPKPQVASEPKKVEVPKQKKGGKKKGVIALLAVAVLLLAVLITAVAVVMQMFPVEVTITDPEETKTTTGRFVDLSFDIEANQSIRGVSYALDPADENNTELYTKIESVTNQKKQTVTIEELKVPVGDSTLYLYVQTAFGESFHEVDLEFDFGYLAAPDPDAIVTMDDGSEIVNGELLVVLNKSLSEKKAENLFAEYGGEIIGQVYALNQYQVSFADTDVYALEDIRSDLSQNELVSSVCFNGVIGHDVAVYPDDSGYDDWNTDYPAGNNWALECIDAPGAWEYNSQMSTVKVGVVDSVLDYDHPDLKVNPQNSTYLATNDFKTLEELMDYYDEVTADHECNWWNALWGTTCTLCEMKNHGTHVAGIIGATANNGLGTSGVNWNAELCFGNWWYYTIPENGERLEKYSTFAGSTYQIARLVMSGCRVVNVSIGAAEATDRVDNEDDMSAYFENIVSHMEENGYDFLITKAAGNADYDASNCYLNRVFTAGESARAHTLIVAAVENHEFLGVFSDDWRYSVADYSNYGELVDIAAPGTDVYSTVMDGYESMPGTSMAAPMVAGVASLLYSLDENLTYDQVKEILLSATDNYCSKKQFVYPIVNARMAVESYLNNGVETPEPEIPTAGFVTGLIQDAKTENLIESAVVKLTHGETGDEVMAFVDRGTYYTWAPPGTYTMEFHAEGYQTETIYGVEITEGVVNYNILLNMVEEVDTVGQIYGRVVDAFDASSIPNANLTVYAGVNNTAGTPVATGTADAYGAYSFELSPGNYTVYASAEGYTPGTANLLVVGDETRYDQDCTLTPILENGEIRVVLTWNEFPYDLDSHLTGPSPYGDRFHVYYSSQNYYYNGEQYVNLDVDDINSYGPETTSVYIPVDGSYTFYVHNYSNRSASFSNDLATSGAKVTVYLAGRVNPYVFYVPNEEGTLWEVFTIENGTLRPTNEMSYQSSPSDVGL